MCQVCGEFTSAAQRMQRRNKSSSIRFPYLGILYYNTKTGPDRRASRRESTNGRPTDHDRLTMSQTKKLTQHTAHNTDYQTLHGIETCYPTHK